MWQIKIEKIIDKIFDYLVNFIEICIMLVQFCCICVLWLGFACYLGAGSLYRRIRFGI